MCYVGMFSNNGFVQATEKSEVQDHLNYLLSQPGAEGYVVINYDGIPVKHYPETLAHVQYAALIADLVMKTKQTLKQLNHGDSEFSYLRMRTSFDTEFIVTDFITQSSGNEYILVCI